MLLYDIFWFFKEMQQVVAVVGDCWRFVLNTDQPLLRASTFS